MKLRYVQTKEASTSLLKIEKIMLKTKIKSTAFDCYLRVKLEHNL